MVDEVERKTTSEETARTLTLSIGASTLSSENEFTHLAFSQ
jgi:hypothetical protein